MLSLEIGKKALKRKKKATQFNVHSKTGQAYAYVHIKKAGLKQKQSAIYSSIKHKVLFELVTNYSCRNKVGVHVNV